MSQVRIVKEDGSDTTYHNCTGVTSSRNGSPVTSITVQWKSDAQGVPFVEKRVPDDGQVIYVMDDRGHTMNTYRLPSIQSIYTSSDADAAAVQYGHG